jgi:dihydrodipicolinate synthase/N-acetylneuraminate lyase
MIDKKLFEGIVAPMVNPCFEDDSLDMAGVERNLERLLETDVAGLYINGGTGDAANLSQQERLDIAAYLVPKLLEKGKLAVVHVGQTSQRQAVELARQAVELGAQAVASIPPKKPWPQIVEYYKALCATGANVIVYYIPGVTGMTASMAELRMMLDIPGVIGIKMSDYNIFLMRSVMLEYPDKVVYTGLDEMLIPGLFYGADGSIGTWGNLLPKMYTKAFAKVKAGQVDDLKELMEEFTAFLAIGWNYGIIDTFEELMRAKGYANRCFRRPTAWNPGKVPAEVLEDLLARMDRINALADAL